jgi:hypothetical protein
MRWEGVLEGRESMDLKGDGCRQFEATIMTFAWRERREETKTKLRSYGNFAESGT